MDIGPEIYTLNPDGTYDLEPVLPEMDTARYGDWPAYRSPVLNRVVRTWPLSPPDHVLQWWDEARGWMDLEILAQETARSDGHADGLQQGRQEGLENSIDERLMLLAALDPPERDRLAANWRRFGRVPDIMDVLAVHTALAGGIEAGEKAQVLQRLDFAAS